MRTPIYWKSWDNNQRMGTCCIINACKLFRVKAPTTGIVSILEVERHFLVIGNTKILGKTPKWHIKDLN